MTPAEEVREYVALLRRAVMATEHLEMVRAHAGKVRAEDLAEAVRLEEQAVEALATWLEESTAP